MRPGKVTAAALLACLIAPASAGASLVQVTGSGDLLIEGSPGEANRIQIFYKTADEAGFDGTKDRIVVVDNGARPLSGSPECVAFEPTKVSCVAAPVRAVSADLGDADDVFAMNAALPGVPASKLPSFVHGGPGNDVMVGGDAVDRMFGDGGRDVIAGGRSNDVLHGGPDADAVIGSFGNDVLDGGPGPDAVFGQLGRDVMLGGGGRDTILARDGIRDRRINCGGGGGKGLLDNKDPKAQRCGKTTRKGK
jgi:Ca2+-binding RTX toxin-like protein